MELTEKQLFEIHNEAKLGHMRCIFGSNNLHGQWISTSKCNKNININEIQKSINELTDQYKFFDSIYQECKKKYGDIDFSSQGINYPVDLFATEGNFNYWVRLMAQKNDYNMYISVYSKKVKEN